MKSVIDTPQDLEKHFNQDKEIEKTKKQTGYNGCKNCRYQIEPLRMCEWAEQGGDGRVHLICPRWERRKP